MRVPPSSRWRAMSRTLIRTLIPTPNLTARRARQVRRAQRSTMGVKLINLDAGASVVAVARNVEDTDTDTDPDTEPDSTPSSAGTPGAAFDDGCQADQPRCGCLRRRGGAQCRGH